jgi:hypothetical protein
MSSNCGTSLLYPWPEGSPEGAEVLSTWAFVGRQGLEP